MTVSAPAISRGEARQFVASTIEERCRPYERWTPRWKAVAKLSRNVVDDRIVAPMARLYDLRILRDVSRLQLTAEAIERWMRSRCPVPEQHWSKFDAILGTGELTTLCQELAATAKICPGPIRYALGGNLAQAVRVIPVTGVGNDSGRHVLDLIDSIAHYNLLGDLIEAAGDTYIKMFEPTGHHMIDGDPGIKAARFGKSGQNILDEEAWLQVPLNTYPAVRHRVATRSEIALLESLPGVTREARALQKELEVRYGALDTQSVDHLFCRCSQVLPTKTRKCQRRNQQSALGLDQLQCI